MKSFFDKNGLKSGPDTLPRPGFMPPLRRFYPAAARKMGLQGDVVLRLFIDGKPEAMTIPFTFHFVLD